MTRLRNYFLTGFVICAPVTITIYITIAIIRWIDSWVKPYIPYSYNPDQYLPFAIPGIGLIVAIAFITIVGFLTANLIGRSIVSYGEKWLARMPIVRNVYSALKQIFETILTNNSKSFQKVVLIEYPRKGLWAIAFVAADTMGEVKNNLNKKTSKTISVFLPTTPNPTSGFLLFVPEKDVIYLDMNVEEAAKLVISAGLVVPDPKKSKKQKDKSQKKDQKNKKTKDTKEN